MTDNPSPTMISIIPLRGERPYPRAVAWSREAAEAVVEKAAEVLPGVELRLKKIAGVA